jgi:hypothetical protein
MRLMGIGDTCYRGQKRVQVVDIIQADGNGLDGHGGKLRVAPHCWSSKPPPSPNGIDQCQHEGKVNPANAPEQGNPPGR